MIFITQLLKVKQNIYSLRVSSPPPPPMKNSGCAPRLDIGISAVDTWAYFRHKSQNILHSSASQKAYSNLSKVTETSISKQVNEELHNLHFNQNIYFYLLSLWA
jgi:hypothetical protein